MHIDCARHACKRRELELIIKYIVEGFVEGTLKKVALKVRNHECSVVSLGKLVLRMTFRMPC